jgi:ABC-2 type transport system ATP-binding protein
MNAIETTGLNCRFRQLEAVHSLDLTVPAGSVYALLGPNGAGKSTTIKMLMNLLRPTGGTARVLGVDSQKLGPAEFARIGYVAETIDLPEWMTVGQFLNYCRPFYKKWDIELEKTLLQKFDLPPARKIKHLSRGMRMKTLLLSVLAYRPDLLVLDEPFSGLDPVVRDDFIRGVLEVSSLGNWTVFVSSHDIEEVERLADWVGLIENGKLKLAEKLDSLQQRFRRIEITRIAANASPVKKPAHWYGFEEAGTLTRFVETRYNPDETEKLCAEIFPGSNITAQPLPLREIYLALARGDSAPQPSSALR